MIARTTPKAVASALFLLFALPAAAYASDIEDCRSKAEVSNEARLKACSAVIDGKQATDTDLAYAHYRRAMVASANPNADQALVMADVSKAIDLDPKLTEAYTFRAIGYMRAMQYDKAIADLSKAIELSPDRWSLYSFRAMAYVQKKDAKNGIADYQAALSHNPPASSAEMIRQRIAKLEQALPQ